MAFTVRRAGLAVYEHHAPGAPGAPDAAARVVFVHGAMDRAAAFIKVQRILRPLEIVRYDRRGYGRSLEAGVADGMGPLVDDLVAVLDGRPAVVVGHSMGGLVALATAARHPHLVQAIAAFEAPMPWLDWWPKGTAGGQALGVAEGGEGAVAERFLRAMIGDDQWDRFPEPMKAVRRAEGPALLADLRAIRAEDAPVDVVALAARGLPIVAGCGTTSSAHHLRSAAELAVAVGGADASPFRIDGAGHGAHTSHPDEFAAFVRLAVDAVTGPAAHGSR